MPAEGLDGPQLGVDEPLAADGLAPLIAEAVELKVDFEPMLEARDRRDELRIVREAEAVRVDQDLIDGTRATVFEDAQELRVNGRFAAGKLQYLGAALDLHEAIDGG